MLRGGCGIPCPSVLFPMRAVRGEIVEIGQIAAPAHLENTVGRLIRAAKRTTLFQIGTHDQIGQKPLCGLLRGDAGHIQIAEPVIGEHGLENLFLFTSHHIDIPLGITVRIKIDIVIIHRAVHQLLAALDVDALAGRPLNLQPENAGIVLPEVIDVAARPDRRFLRSLLTEQALTDIRPGSVGHHLSRTDFHRLQFLCDCHRVCLAESGLSPGPLRGYRIMPCPILRKSGLCPSCRLLPPVIKYP